MDSCPTCQCPLPSGIPGGFCPKCLLGRLYQREDPPLEGDDGAEEVQVVSPPPAISGMTFVRKLGEGGMGVVWLVRQLATGQEVAVKILPAWHVPDSKRDDLARARFAREIELAARLSHPHIARVFDGGQAGSRPYFVMEYVQGEPLNEYATRHELDRRERLLLVRKVSDAVAYAHRRGVIHRDLKPSNILVDDDGVPKLLDFGLAKGLESELTAGATLTLEGTIAGTPEYMSPEQAAGHLDQIDSRTDIYSLGVILYEMLSGRSPYRLASSPVELARRVADCEIIRPRTACPDLGSELEMLLLKALAKDPGERYGDVQAFGDDIGRYLDGLPLWAGNSTTTYFVRKWFRRHRRACIAAASALVLVSGAGFYHWNSLRREKEAVVASELKETEARRRFLRSAVTENMQRGAYRDALGFIEQALALDPADAVDEDLLFQRIEALEAMDDPRFIELGEALACTPLSARGQARLDCRMAERMLVKGEGEEALVMLERAVKTGLLPVADAEMARAALSGSVAEAAGHYRTAASLAPWRPTPQMNLVVALFMSGQERESEVRLEQCRLLFPEYEAVDILDAALRVLKGDEKGGMEILNRMPEDASSLKNAVTPYLGPVARFASGLALGACGLQPATTLADEIRLALLLRRFTASPDKGHQVPVFAGVGPAVARGLKEFSLGMVAYQMRDHATACARFREAVAKNDIGDYWLMLSHSQLEQESYADAIAAARTCRTKPSVFPGVREAAYLAEALGECRFWIARGKEDVEALKRANVAFKAAFFAGAPFDAARSAALGVAVKAGDLVFARLLAETLPAGSVQRLDAMAKIELADGNLGKARAIAEEGLKLDPENASLRRSSDEAAMRAKVPCSDSPPSE